MFCLQRSHFSQHKHSLKCPEVSIKTSGFVQLLTQQTQLQLVPRSPQSIKWFCIYKCWSTVLSGVHPLHLLIWKSCHKHVAWTWYDTYCKNANVVTINVNLSVVWKNKKQTKQHCIQATWLLVPQFSVTLAGFLLYVAADSWCHIVPSCHCSIYHSSA